MGSASMSARSASVLPPGCPSKMAATPVSTPGSSWKVAPSPVRTSLILAAVRNSFRPSSGCMWKSRRVSTSHGYSGCSSGARMVPAPFVGIPTWPFCGTPLARSRRDLARGPDRDQHFPDAMAGGGDRGLLFEGAKRRRSVSGPQIRQGQARSRGAGAPDSRLSGRAGVSGELERAVKGENERGCTSQMGRFQHPVRSRYEIAYTSLSISLRLLMPFRNVSAQLIL